MADYSTLAYVKTALQISASTYDTVLSQFITAVSLKFKNYLQKELATTTYTEVHNGTNLTQIKFGLIDTTVTTVTNTEFVYEASTGLIQFKQTSTQKQAFQGWQNIEVDYIGGYGTAGGSPNIPEDIQEGVAIQCNKLLSLYNIQDFGVESVKVGDDTVTYALPFEFANNYPLLGEVKSILDPYKNRSY